MLISYAQNMEDVFVHRCFADRAKGRYIDVGASSPVRDSPSYACYERGWQGVAIEPIAERVAEWRRLRPRDITIQAVAGAVSGQTTLFRTDGVGGRSSCMASSVEALRVQGSAIDKITVPVITLDAVCAKHKITDVQLLKIDVEGYEEEVLQGFAFDYCRPELLIIETLPIASDIQTVNWLVNLNTAGYVEVYDDGLNKYFVAREADALRVHFSSPVGVLDGVLQHNALGSCLRRTDHRDHSWAVSFAETLFGVMARMPAEQTLALLTNDIATAALDAPLNLDAINRAYKLVLNRWIEPHEAGPLIDRAAVGLTLRHLIRELLDSEEYLGRVGRSAAST
jgi:FkbM family methyltransferase